MLIRDLPTTEGTALYLMLFLVNIFTEINHRKKASTKTCFYLIVFKNFSLSRATLRDTNSSNNKQFKINQFVIQKVKKVKY